MTEVEKGKQRFYIHEFGDSDSLTEKHICIIDKNHTQDNYFDICTCRDEDYALLMCDRSADLR